MNIIQAQSARSDNIKCCTDCLQQKSDAVSKYLFNMV